MQNEDPDAFARHSIHVVAAPGDPSLISGVDISSWDDIKSHNLLDMFSQRAVHGKRSIRRDCANRLIYNIRSPHHPRTWAGRLSSHAPHEPKCVRAKLERA